MTKQHNRAAAPKKDAATLAAQFGIPPQNLRAIAEAVNVNFPVTKADAGKLESYLNAFKSSGKSLSVFLDELAAEAEQESAPEYSYSVHGGKAASYEDLSASAQTRYELSQLVRGEALAAATAQSQLNQALAQVSTRLQQQAITLNIAAMVQECAATLFHLGTVYTDDQDFQRAADEFWQKLEAHPSLSAFSPQQFEQLKGQIKQSAFYLRCEHEQRVGRLSSLNSAPQMLLGDQRLLTTQPLLLG